MHGFENASIYCQLTVQPLFDDFKHTIKALIDDYTVQSEPKVAPMDTFEQPFNDLKQKRPLFISKEDQVFCKTSKVVLEKYWQ